WQDQSSDDAAKAAEFYRQLFGWDIPPGDPNFGGYSNASLNGRIVAGISPQMQPGPAYWAVYVNVGDAGAVADLVTSNGGQVFVEPLQVGEFGTMAVFADPAGAAIGVWQPGTHKGAEVRNEPRAVCWYELLTGDVEAAARFYSAVFGWEARSHGPSGGPGGYTEFRLGDKMIAGMMAKPPMMPADAPSAWGVYFAVDDTDAAAARVTEIGGRVVVPPTDTPPGRFAVCADSTGAFFNLLKSSRG
ncbi:MAG TPA: VOC family protein, partial [Actinomycetota bacterium]|nr:VOC family protein [Actinomycetota bacterium]